MMWVSAFRRDLLTLGNNTTNRIESFNSLVKAELRKRRGLPPSLPETIGILLELVAKKDSSASYKNFRNNVTVVSNVKFPAMTPAGSLYNDAGFRLLESQFEKMSRRNFVLHSNASGVLTVEDVQSGKLYDLTCGPEDALECTCTFSSAFLGLPCCHLLYSRKERALDLFDSTAIPDRWSCLSVFADSVVGSAEAVGSSEAQGAQEACQRLGTESCLQADQENCDYSSADDDAGRLRRVGVFMYVVLLELA